MYSTRSSTNIDPLRTLNVLKKIKIIGPTCIQNHGDELNSPEQCFVYCRKRQVISTGLFLFHGGGYFMLAGYTYCSLRLEVDKVYQFVRKCFCSLISEQ